jgi:hypothetical protein
MNQHDGATAHTTRNNLLYLQQFHGNRIIIYKQQIKS